MTARTMIKELLVHLKNQKWRVVKSYRRVGERETLLASRGKNKSAQSCGLIEEKKSAKAEEASDVSVTLYDLGMMTISKVKVR